MQQIIDTSSGTKAHAMQEEFDKINANFTEIYLGVTAIPTADPHNAGQLYKLDGVYMVSMG